MIISRNEEDVYLDDVAVRGQKLKLAQKFVWLH